MDIKQQKIISILRSWHAIEFFQPYTLPDSTNRVKVTTNELHGLADNLFPWLNPIAKKQLNAPDNKKINYILYLGLFDKSLLNEYSKNLASKYLVNLTHEELEERLDLEGDTCFAKLILDEFGKPDFATMSVSTLPWAIGQLINNQLSAIDLQNFNQRCLMLKEALNRVSLTLPYHPNNKTHRTLNAKALQHILNNLYEWADFFPDTPPNFCLSLEWFTVKNKDNPFSEKLLANKAQLPVSSESESWLTTEAEPKNEGDEEKCDTVSDELTMPILNSFYIAEIEKITRSVECGEVGQGLLQYLGINHHKYHDLYTQESLPFILQHIKPRLTPLGRWPSDVNHNMSLMQQFAINTSIVELKDAGLISVNGPPGTGKTTLLRDIIAHNIVQRAEILASFSDVTQSIDQYGFPVDKLFGFEMVVASSNNAAVENISKELPLKSSLGSEFRQLDYFKPVANLLAANEIKGKLTPLSEQEQCWGLIAAALGRKKKCTDFKERFFFYKKNSDKTKGTEVSLDDDKLDFLNFWDWKKNQNTPSFKEAKQKFLEKKQEVEQVVAQLERLSCLAEDLIDAKAQAEYLIETLELTEISANQLVTQLEQNKQQYSIIEQKLLQLQINPPNLLHRLFKTIRYQQHRLAQQQLLNSSIELQTEHLLINVKLQENQQKILSTKKQQELITNKLNEYQLLAAKYEIQTVPDATCKINDANFQRQALWQNNIINRLRSELFICSMNLHQSWVMEALKNKEFRDVIFTLKDLLEGKSIKQAEKLWKTLFLIIPVISTTFASMGRMFNKFTAQQIGWLMIDEAGQASPQQAIGGIWRAKRTLIVGDPLQIEPVFTTSPTLIHALAAEIIGDDYEYWSPHLWSVQQFADRVNPYGCYLSMNGQNIWIGIPLWVHRRCIEPMFSIANAIAYNNRMIHGFTSDKIMAKPHPILGQNSWFSTIGTCTDRQYFSELADVTLNLLGQLVNHEHSIANIYIITPFKAIKRNLIQTLDNNKSLLINKNMDRSGYAKWRSNNIGTVHTFQGKENSIVILVLGCDTQNNGGATWASSKPNLLNVALTRAKSNIYVIGNPEVWQNKPYFKSLAEKISLT